MFSAKIKSLVYYEHHHDDYITEHSHNCYECVFYLNGKGKITVENEVYNYSGPTISIVGPGKKHDEETEEFSQLYIVLFELDDNRLFDRDFIFSVDEATKKVFQQIFEQILEEEKKCTDLSLKIMNSYFDILLSYCLRNVDGMTSNEHNADFVERVKGYIKENYKQDIDFKTIATSYGYSYDRFRHIFVEETGTSLNQYLLNCRLYAAKQLLINTKLTVKKIAKECGFSNEVYFNIFFTKRMNMSPLKFRNSSEHQIDVGVLKLNRNNLYTKKIIIDTDLGGDCDDVGAVSLANIMHNQGLIDIKAITYTTSLEWGPLCVDAINHYYGNDNIPLGVTSRNNFCEENTNKYAEKMSKAFHHNATSKKDYMDSVRLIRKVLAEAEDNSITLAFIGQLNNGADLLDSTPDDISPLNGVELVAKKVSEVVIMGGLFKEENETVYFCGYPYEREYNIICDILSSQKFIHNLPCKVVFNDFKVGYQIHTGKPLLDKMDMSHPITFAYNLFQNSPRESWDLLTVWYAALGISDLFTLSNSGTVEVLDDGTTIFTENSEGKHFYTRLSKDIEYTVNRIDEVLEGGKIYE